MLKTYYASVLILSSISGHLLRSDDPDKPLTLKHAESGWIIYVESNREVLTAISTDGKVVMTVNVVKQAFDKEKYGRKPKIGEIVDQTWKEMIRMGTPSDIEGKPLRKSYYLAISFSGTREFGFLDLKTGKYHYQGGL